MGNVGTLKKELIYTIKINEFSYKNEKELRCWFPKDRLRENRRPFQVWIC